MTDSKLPGSVPQSQQQPLPPPAYPTHTQPAYGYHGQTNVVFAQPNQPQSASTFHFRAVPALVICQHCNATVTTNTTFKVGLMTWVSCGVVALVGCWLGCCLIPFCLDVTKDVDHTCPNCSNLVGTFRQFS